MRVKLIRVFVSSPGDLSAERDIVRKVVREINSDLGNIHSFRLECLMWEDLSSRISLRPQEAISKAFESFEVFLGLMGFYFGTPTGDFGSGTEEEYNLALQQWRDGRLEFIQFYFSSAAVDASLLDTDQLKKVQDFRKNIGSDGVLYNMFSDLKVLEARVRSALISDVYQMLEAPESQIEHPQPTNYKNLNPYGHMKALNQLMEQRPEAAITFLTHAGVTSMDAATNTLNEITKQMNLVGRKTASFSRSAIDIQKGRNKQKMALKQLEELYAGIESLLRLFASETPKLEENFSSAISNFHRAAEIAMNLSEDDQKSVFNILETLENLKSSMQDTSASLGDLAMPEVVDLGARWEIGRLTLEAVVSDFREFLARGVDAIDVVSQALKSRKNLAAS